MSRPGEKQKDASVSDVKTIRRIFMPMLRDGRVWENECTTGGNTATTSKCHFRALVCRWLNVTQGGLSSVTEWDGGERQALQTAGSQCNNTVAFSGHRSCACGETERDWGTPSDFLRACSVCSSNLGE